MLFCGKILILFLELEQVTSLKASKNFRTITHCTLAEILDWTWLTRTMEGGGQTSHHISLMICKYRDPIATVACSMRVVKLPVNMTLPSYGADFCLGEPVAVLFSLWCSIFTDLW